MPEFISTEAYSAPVLHPMAEKVARSSARLKPLEESTPIQARALRKAKGNPFAPPSCDLYKIEDRQIKTSQGLISLRIYTPAALKPVSNIGSATALAGLVFFHGGGFVVGSVQQYDTLTQQLAYHSGCVVVSVDYKLAPEFKSGAIYRQGYDAYHWFRENCADYNVDKNRIAVGGDSAGANLAIAVSQLCQIHGTALPAFQQLIYPVTDWSMSAQSIEDFAEGYFLTKGAMGWFREHFLEPDTALDNSLVSPLHASLESMPPSMVLTAGFDPLRDEGKAFAEKLSSAGVVVQHLCYTDMIHGFLSFAGGIPAGMQALEALGKMLKEELT
ncbi:MAG: hypothetical protein COC19_00380 [SAR86 cluster bacterium]|uniref:Alpha/beta hydrolase fold-3 domain-containing protein n=1 Tax=SAR86 cluster bacterium TaxID=2030880 RepID=A0A2A4MV81_9GAMM|nr:MAG: hypothetical protein COC19_00380 [SAR86 cluster bacterium]